jgi:caspase domain-containing protein
MTAAADNREKRALLIGIDKYPMVGQLAGCVNDVELMQSILQDGFGFPPDQVALLRNEQASRDLILAALDALVEKTRKDDIVVIHYAGHGSQMTDREGDEPDGMDETIVPFDSGRGADPNRDITDDEIHLRLVKLGAKTPFTTLIFDSCHSGTITRDVFGMKSRSIPPDTRSARDLPPSPIPRELWPELHETTPTGWVPTGGSYVLIAGCRDEETSFEYRPPDAGPDDVHGALTYFLTQELRRATPGSSYRDVFERAAANVTATNAAQHPQMEGSADREIFGIGDFEPMRFVRVRARAGDVVTLAGGAAHGMTVGSEWAVYPQGTKHTHGVEPVGHVAITAVHAVVSEARIVREGADGRVAPGGRAVETTHVYGDLSFKVQVVGEARWESDLVRLRADIERSRLLQLVDETAPASARIYLMGARGRVTSADHVPQLGALTAPTWAVVSTDGDLMMPPRQRDNYDEIVPNLEKLARYREALAVENPDRGSTLRGKITVELLRKVDDGRWVVATPDAGGQVVFEDGDAIGFLVTNHHEAPVFFTLLDFGLTGRITVLYGGNEQLRTGAPFMVGGSPTAGGFDVWVPDEYPYADNPNGPLAEGSEAVKLFATVSQTDFGYLAQRGVRSADALSPLELLWRTTADSPTSRDARPKVRVGNEDWTTVVKTFVVRRRGAVPVSPAGRSYGLGEQRR